MSGVVPVVQADRETWERALEIYYTGFDRDGRACSPDDEIARHRLAETARLEAEIERRDKLLREVHDEYGHRLPTPLVNSIASALAADTGEG